jgi:hypothetical protein
MDERGAGIETACVHLQDAIALLDRLGEDAEAAHVSLSLERLTSKYGFTGAAFSSRDPV